MGKNFRETLAGQMPDPEFRAEWEAQTRSYMWLYRTDREDELPIVLYEYQPSRKAEHAERFLEGFSGYLHVDGYQGCHKLPESIRVVGFWAYARRKLDEALNALPLN